MAKWMEISLASGWIPSSLLVIKHSLSMFIIVCWKMPHWVRVFSHSKLRFYFLGDFPAWHVWCHRRVVAVAVRIQNVLYHMVKSRHWGSWWPSHAQPSYLRLRCWCPSQFLILEGSRLVHLFVDRYLIDLIDTSRLMYISQKSIHHYP